MFNTLKVTSIFYQMNKCFIKSNKIDKKRSITEKKIHFHFTFCICTKHQYQTGAQVFLIILYLVCNKLKKKKQPLHGMQIKVNVP